MSVTTWTKSWSEWKLYGPGYGWSTWYIATATITVTRTIGSDTATVKIDTSMTTTSGDTSLGPWQCVVSINGATSGGGEKVFDISAAGLHVKNTAYTKSETYTVGVGVSSGTLSGTIKFHEDGYPGYQGEYSPSESWSLSYESKGTPSQATWSNAYFGNASTITIQRTVPDFRESVYLVWQDDTSHPVTIRTYSQSSATSISYTIPYNALPNNAQTRSAKIRVVSYNGSTQVGTWETSAVSVAIKTGDTTYNPTLTSDPVCEAYNDVVAALGTDTAVAQYSKINVKAKKADVSLKYSATIVSRVVTFSNGSSASADQENHISSLIQSAGDVTWTYTVTDSRGIPVTKTGKYTVINSSAPSITDVDVYRGDSGGTAQEGGAYIYATATASCESLGGHNSVTLKGKVDSGAYQSMTSETRKTLKSDADANTQYLVTLTATDLLRSTSQTIIVPSLDLPVHIPSGKHGMGIGMKGTSDDTLKVGYDAKFYGGLEKHDSVKNIDIDLVRTTDSLVGGAWTEIPASANLNTEAYIAVGKYFCGSDVTAATLSNCPTGNAFYMSVRNVTKPNADISAEQLYFVREILTYLGDRYIQNVSHASGGTNTYGNWYRLNKTIASESGNAAEWLKAQVYRPSSLDFQHIYDDSRVHSRLDISSSALSGGVNSIFGEGFVLTFMWDNSGSWDTQLYLPDSAGNAPGFRTHNHSTNQWSAVTRLCTDKVTKTEITNLTIGSPHASYGGCYYEVSNNLVHVHMGVSGLTAGGTSGQTVYTMPSGYRPSTVCVAAGIGSNRSYYSNMTVDTSGNVSINSQSTYAECDIWYFI